MQNDGRYEILNVIGPDEYKEDVDNNVYTNYMAYFNLASARDILKDKNYQVVEKQGTKTRGLDDGRTILISLSLRKILEKYIKTYNITDYLFLTRHNKFMDECHLNNMWKSIRKK